MAISVRSVSDEGSAAFTTSVAIPVPSGAASGDIVVCSFSMWSNSATPSGVPSGFTLINHYTDGGSVHLWSYWKRLTGGDTGTYTFSWSGNAWTTGQAVCFSGGLASGSPVEGFWTASSSSFPTVSGITTTTANVGMFLYVGTGSGTISWTAPTSQGGWTIIGGTSDSQDNGFYNIISGTLSSASITGGSDTGSGQGAQVVAIKPAASATNVNLNHASETDTARTVARLKKRALNHSTGVNTAEAIGRLKQKTVRRTGRWRVFP